MRKNNSKGLSRGSIYKLAQTGTAISTKPVIIISGKGTDLTDGNTVKKKAKRKLMSQTMNLNLVKSADKFGSPDLKKAYRNAYYCQSKIFTVNGRIYSKFCKNRSCIVCTANRKADILNRYLPEINSWEEPYFLTLTVKSVPFYRLRATMDSMIKEFQAIVEIQRKKSGRKTGIKLVGIRSLESNFNPRTKEYNPHFHIIVANREMAEILLNEWLKRGRKKKRINRKGQHMRKVDDTQHDLIEVVKYGSKIFTEQDIYAKGKNKKVLRGKHTIYIAALNNIFHAMRGLRIFERFGFNLPPDSKHASAGSRVVSKYHEWIFHLKSADWLSVDTGNPLCNYIPPAELLDILKNSIDIQKE